MSPRLTCLPALTFALFTLGAILSAQGQQPPRPIELDAVTLAARTEAARLLIPLLKDVKEKAVARYDVGRGSVPDSPFMGTQTTAVAITLGRKTPR